MDSVGCMARFGLLLRWVWRGKRWVEREARLAVIGELEGLGVVHAGGYEIESKLKRKPTHDLS